MIRFVIFDLDGTLVDTEPLHLAAFNAVLQPFGLTISSADYSSRFIGLDDRDCFRAVLEANGKSPSEREIAEMIARKHRVFEAKVRGRELLYPGAAEFVARCAARFPLMVVTGALRLEARECLDAAAISKFFLDVIGADDVERGKPAPDGFVAALGRLGFLLRDRHPVMAAETLVIEDTAAGIAAASAAGMRVLAICHTTSAENLRDADFVRENFAAIDLDEILRALAARSRD